MRRAVRAPCGAAATVTLLLLAILSGDALLPKSATGWKAVIAQALLCQVVGMVLDLNVHPASRGVALPALPGVGVRGIQKVAVGGALGILDSLQPLVLGQI